MCLKKFRANYGDLSLRRWNGALRVCLSSLKAVGTQRNMGQALGHFFSHCVDIGLITDNPADKLQAR